MPTAPAAPTAFRPDYDQAPRYWMDETSGQLAAAVRQYLDNPGSMTLREVALMRAYLRQWIDAPGWDLNPHHNDRSRERLAKLRAAINRIQCAQDLQQWLRHALAAGHDPL